MKRILALCALLLLTAACSRDDAAQTRAPVGVAAGLGGVLAGAGRGEEEEGAEGEDSFHGGSVVRMWRGRRAWEAAASVRA